MSLLNLATARFVAAKHKRFRVQWLKTRNQITMLYDKLSLFSKAKGAVGRLSILAEGHNDISGGVVNLKQPAKGHQTSYGYEVMIVVYVE